MTFRRLWMLSLSLCSAVLLVASVWFATIRLTSQSRALVALTLDPHALAATSRDVLRLGSFNIAHGRGLSEGNYNGESNEIRLERLHAIGDLLRRLDLDMVVLNEVDFDAHWSGGVDQANIIASRAGFTHVIEQTNFDLGLPGWRVRFGNAVLSHYPLVDPEVIDHPSLERWKTLLIGNRRSVACTIEAPQGPIRLIGVHLDPYDEATRIAAARVLGEHIEDRHLPLVIAGDFNTAPRGLDGAEPVERRTAVSLLLDAGLAAGEGIDGSPRHLTWPADHPSIIIDWILVTPDLRVIDHQALATELSDHRPIIDEIGARSRN